jgi:N-methylhydantoinase A/oxoprolinase/acetone carboxylase beta subunit
MTWRVRVTGPPPKVDAKLRDRATGNPLRGSRRVWFAETGGYVEAAVYDRYVLRAGATIAGPAVIEERESTTVIGPGGLGRVDDVGSLEVELT